MPREGKKLKAPNDIVAFKLSGAAGASASIGRSENNIFDSKSHGTGIHATSIVSSHPYLAEGARGQLRPLRCRVQQRFE
jgi:hypothetical protein